MTPEAIPAGAVDRFWSHVVKGPKPDNCWVWTGAISTDGYGRFWLPGDHAVRPHRLAYRLVCGELDDDVTLRHWCDFPLCVHAAADVDRSHLLAGTRADNMADRNKAGNFANQYTGALLAGVRRHRPETMRTIRDHVRAHGYDQAFISETLAGYDADHPTLFEFLP